MSRRRTSRQRSQGRGFFDLKISNKLLFWSAFATFAVSFVLGGAPAHRGLQFTLIVISGLWTLALVVWQGPSGANRRLPLPVLMLIVGIAVLPILQILPLPPVIWGGLGGRALEHEIIDIIGYGDMWLPLSVEPLETAIACLMLVPLLAIFLAAIRMSDDEILLFVLGIAGLTVLAVLVGVIQIVSNGNLFTMHRSAHRGLLLGFFANRNHMATLLASGILIGGYLARRFAGRSSAAIFGASVFAIFMFSGLLGTASRTGLALGLVALVLSVPIFLGFGKKPLRNVAIVASTGFVVAAAAFSLSGVVGKVVDRYDAVNTDLRWTIWEHSKTIAGDYLPFGAGFGSFSNVYKKYEQLEWVIPVYINHAHNDYIELAIEGGWPAIALVALFIWVWLSATVFALRMPEEGPASVRRQSALLASAIVLLLLLHSSVDYPLRTASVAVLLALCLGWLVRPRLV